jgi:hypothetical protein
MILNLLAAAALQAASPAAAPDYSKDGAWLCLPGRDDACSRPLPTTALTRSGYGAAGQALPAKDPPADCFYVYPTVSRDRGLNRELAAKAPEQGAATVQFARFASVCRTFAPLYRQVTLAALPRAFAGQDIQANFDLAYGDVLAAWRDFLGRRNNGRPFVLIGHSQGSIHLLRLLRQELDGRPDSKRMLSAILLGWTVEVPEGKTVGGSLKQIPLCTRSGQTGCVVTFMSFRAESPPLDPSFLGRAKTAGMTAGCTNPADLARGGPAPLDSYWINRAVTEGPAINWSKAGPPPTPFLRTHGLVTGECRHDGTAGYLAIKVDSRPGDQWTDRIPGDVYLFGQINRGWGLHTVDSNVAQGDLIGLVAAQERAWKPQRPSKGRR